MLTPHERRVLQLLSDGRSNEEIAAVLGISAKTVKIHLTKMYAKLGIDTTYHGAARVQAARWWWQEAR